MARFDHSYVPGTSLLTSTFEADDVLDDAFDYTNSEELLASCDDSHGMPYYFTQHKENHYE